jgi:hypothetical protein
MALALMIVFPASWRAPEITHHPRRGRAIFPLMRRARPLPGISFASKMHIDMIVLHAYTFDMNGGCDAQLCFLEQ